MSKITQMFQSRTFWTLVVMFATDCVSIFGAHIPAPILALINLGLSTAATYFHINPNQQYTPTGVTPPNSSL